MAKHFLAICLIAVSDVRQATADSSDALLVANLRGPQVLAEASPKAAESLSSDGAEAAVLFLKSPFGMAFGVALGISMMVFAGKSIKRTKMEQARINKLFNANTSVEQLQAIADSGKELPSLVIIRGFVSADGPDIEVVASKIDGLKEQVGEIHQPDNDYLKIARMAKSNQAFKPLTDRVAAQTGVQVADIPDVPDDFTNATASFCGNAAVLSEMLVARLCPNISVSEDNDTGRKTIDRTPRNRSYCCFYARNISDGFHVLDMQGGRIDIKLPTAGFLPQFSPIHHGEAPSLFLPTANVDEEFFSYLRKEGLTVQGKHLDFSNLPPSKITSPDTLLSKFIFVDVQSSTDLGAVSGNSQVLKAISDGYGGGKMLWEPLGFYDHRGESLADFVECSFPEDKRSKMVSPEELVEKATMAASRNSEKTPYCEPTFSREQLVARRNEENCFRYTELAIPRGSDVTILAKPIKGSDGKLVLIAPNSVEDGADPDNPEAERFRFRILKGHTVENLLKQRSVNIMTYFGFAVSGAFLTFWAAKGYPGLH